MYIAVPVGVRQEITTNSGETTKKKLVDVSRWKKLKQIYFLACVAPA